MPALESILQFRLPARRPLSHLPVDPEDLTSALFPHRIHHELLVLEEVRPEQTDQRDELSQIAAPILASRLVAGVEATGLIADDVLDSRVSQLQLVEQLHEVNEVRHDLDALMDVLLQQLLNQLVENERDDLADVHFLEVELLSLGDLVLDGRE